MNVTITLTKFTLEFSSDFTIERLIVNQVTQKSLYITLPLDFVIIYNVSIRLDKTTQGSRSSQSEFAQVESGLCPLFLSGRRNT